jgi:hypothetical protein
MAYAHRLQQRQTVGDEAALVAKIEALAKADGFSFLLSLCSLVDEPRPRSRVIRRRAQIAFVASVCAQARATNAYRIQVAGRSSGPFDDRSMTTLARCVD